MTAPWGPPARDGLCAPVCACGGHTRRWSFTPRGRRGGAKRGATCWGGGGWGGTGAAPHPGRTDGRTDGRCRPRPLVFKRPGSHPPASPPSLCSGVSPHNPVTLRGGSPGPLGPPCVPLSPPIYGGSVRVVVVPPPPRGGGSVCVPAVAPPSPQAPPPPAPPPAVTWCHCLPRDPARHVTQHTPPPPSPLPRARGDVSHMTGRSTAADPSAPPPPGSFRFPTASPPLHSRYRPPSPRCTTAGTASGAGPCAVPVPTRGWVGGTQRRGVCTDCACATPPARALRRVRRRRRFLPRRGATPIAWRRRWGRGRIPPPRAHPPVPDPVPVPARP